MAIRTLELFHVAVPLRSKVKHASYERTVSDNLVVRVALDDGSVGHGEGVPRSYVTGETIESTFDALRGVDLARQVGSPTTFEEAACRAGGLRLEETDADPRGMFGNAARCALELALLDAFGHKFGRSVGDAIRLCDAPGLELTARPTRVRYSGAITASSKLREEYSAWKMWLYGFHQLKLKVGVDGQDDPSRLKTVRSIVGRKIDLRIDANEAWPASQLRERVRPLLAFRPSVLEQPVAHGEVDSLAEIRPTLGLPVMLDESLCGYPDAELAVARKTADLFNVRLSKCGGLWPSLRILGLARRSGLGVQLGCHPGETGILSAAGRHLASNVRGLRYVEGSYDGHILERNVITGDLTFGYGGWALPLTGPGLGVEVDPEALAAMTAAREEIGYD